MDSYTWQAAPFSWRTARRLAEELHAPLLLGIVLARRGFEDPEEARKFLEVDPQVPDPFLFSDMEAAVDLLAEAVRRQRRVVVHGDYDVDGISATALLIRGLADLGLQAEWYLPSRFVEGYGLSSGAVRSIAEAGDALLITVDCGVAYPREVAEARAAGLDVIVTDHHRPGDHLPDGPVIHPAVGAYPGEHLCGVGVAFKLLHGLHVMLRGVSPDRLPPELERHLDLVALGTVADLVPLEGENRYYVQQGLVRLGITDKPGLRELLARTGDAGPPDTETIAFRLGPRLNAAGRIEDPQKPLRLLITDGEEEAKALAAELDQLNRQRQEVERKIFERAASLVEALPELPPAIVIGGPDWHEGVIGIVASRLVERYHRPTVLLAHKGERARGSGRSIPAYDLMEGLKAADGLLEEYGGHRQAAGLSIAVENIEAFRETLVNHVAERLTPDDFLRTFSPDAIVRGRDLNLEVADSLNRLAPFGMGNPRVHLLALGSRVENAQLTRKGDHLRCNLRVDGVAARGIGFRLGRVLDQLEEDPHCHAGLLLQVGEWNGFTRAEVQLHSLYRPNGLGEEALGCSPGCPFLDDLDAQSACDRCASPYADVERPRARVGDDVRDQGGYLSYIAQVLSSGEPAAVVGVSVPHRMGPIAGRLPLRELGVTGVDCLSRTCWRTRNSELRREALLFCDWPAAERRVSVLLQKKHVLVVDPPFTAGHTALLADLDRSGLCVHHAYGEEERELSVKLLRPLLHPRDWMALLYRARRQGRNGLEARREAVRQAWERYRLLPAADELQKAEEILAAAGIGQAGDGQSKIDVTKVPAYAAAEAAYEEAIRFCRTQ
ncbi:MAG: hypothetical protein Kow00129_12180 [Thermoleophilia bacterium]